MITDVVISRSIRAIIAIAAVAGAATAAAPHALEAQSGPAVGAVAPDFSLPAATKDGILPQNISLAGLRGRTVVIAFFPKARTPGCTHQMEAYRDQFATLFNEGKDVTVLAVSTDDPETLRKWAAEQKFPVTFVSDERGVLAKPYDVKYPAINMYRRVLFVVAPDGKVTHVMRPFKELSADAYTELATAVKKAGAK